MISCGEIDYLDRYLDHELHTDHFGSISLHTIWLLNRRQQWALLFTRSLSSSSCSVSICRALWINQLCTCLYPRIKISAWDIKKLVSNPNSKTLLRFWMLSHASDHYNLAITLPVYQPSTWDAWKTCSIPALVPSKQKIVSASLYIEDRIKTTPNGKQKITRVQYILFL